MFKRMAAVFTLSAVFLSLLGCSVLYKKEYLSVSDYTEEQHKDNSGEFRSIESYEELKSAITSMVNRHSQEERFRFIGYDGSLQTDLAQACWEVKSETALGGYAVEYMTYDFGRVITYYEAVISIAYKRTQDDIDSIRYLSGVSKLPEELDAALSSFSSRVCFKLTGSSITRESVTAAVQNAFYSNPAACVVMPLPEVNVYPSVGIQKIIEINFEYGKSPSQIRRLKTVLTEKILQFSDSSANGTLPQQALSLFSQLSDACAYDPDNTLRSQNSSLDPSLGTTAYGALADNLADSMGMALAYSALCRQAGIECYVVNGTLDGTAHSWNIIKLDDAYYHADVALVKASGLSESFLRSDNQLLGRYQWNLEAYPICNGSLNYNLLVGGA